MTYISNAREISLLKKAKKASNSLVEALDNDIPIDMLEIDIKNIIETKLVRAAEIAVNQELTEEQKKQIKMQFIIKNISDIEKHFLIILILHQNTR